MKLLFLVLLFAVILYCPSPNHVETGKRELGVVFFGREEVIDKIQDLEGSDYKLSHKYTLYFFIAGVYLSDDGYVLQKKAAFNAYFPLSGEEIKRLQDEGNLPSPLPKYSIPIWRYLFGYSLWIIVGAVVGAPFLRHLMRKLMGKKFCPTCKLELTPHEAETKICGVCHTPLYIQNRAPGV